MADDPEEDSRHKQAIFETAELGTKILSESEEFCRKIEEIANLGIPGFDFVLTIRGLEPGVKRIREPRSPVKFSELALTGNDRKLAKKAGIKMDKKEISDLKRAFLEILRESKSSAVDEVNEKAEEIADSSCSNLEIEEIDDQPEILPESEDDRTTSNILGSIGPKLHTFSAIHRILFIFGLSKISLFKHLHLYRYLNGENIILLMNEKDWMDVLEKIFRSVLRTNDPEIKKGLLLSLESYILCVMKTVEYFEDFED